MLDASTGVVLGVRSTCWSPAPRVRPTIYESDRKSCNASLDLDIWRTLLSSNTCLTCGNYLTADFTLVSSESCFLSLDPCIDFITFYSKNNILLAKTIQVLTDVWYNGLAFRVYELLGKKYL